VFLGCVNKKNNNNLEKKSLQIFKNIYFPLENAWRFYIGQNCTWLSSRFYDIYIKILFNCHLMDISREQVCLNITTTRIHKHVGEVICSAVHYRITSK
jgi:hypothetical protein